MCAYQQNGDPELVPPTVKKIMKVVNTENCFT